MNRVLVFAEKEFFQRVRPSGHAADDAALAAQGVKLQLKGY
jgi:hypothetical protein